MKKGRHLSDSIFTLRDYQIELLKKIHVDLDIHNRLVLCSATGSGKAVMLAHLTRDYLAKGKRVLILCHRNQLIEQLTKTLTQSGVTHGLIKAGYKADSDYLVQLASSQTLNRRHKPEFDLVILDECHLTTYTKSALHYFDTQTKVVGFTATPWSLSKKKQLAEKYNHIIVAKTPGEFIDSGTLCKDRYFALHQVDVKDIRTVAGDFKVDELSNACSHPEVIQKTVNDWLKFGEYRSTACFCVDVKHAIAQQEAFVNNGIPCEIITGETSKGDRLEILKNLDSGKTKVVVSIGVLTEGWDYPALGCVILARPTKSKSLFIQMVGRGLRSHPNKTDCIIIDIANNTLRHGLVRDYKKEDYFLEYEPPKKGGKAPIRKCKECGHIQHPSIKACQECGYVFPIKVKNPYLIDLSDLDDIDKQYRKNIKFAYKKKYSPAYAFYKYMTASDGQKPTLDLALGAIFQGNVTPKDINEYATWIFDYCMDKNKKFGTFLFHFKKEFGSQAKTDSIRKLWINKLRIYKQNRVA